MMELGSGVALAGLCISGGAVVITAIRTFGVKSGKNGLPGKNGEDFKMPCPAHSGIVACMESIEKNQDRQEKWMGDISADIKRLLSER